MSVYRKFKETDVIYSVINASPQVTIVSGTGGWRGNLGTSGTVSLYGGRRSRVQNFNSDGISLVPSVFLPAYTIDGDLQLTGSYPMTSSIRVFKTRPGALQNQSDGVWGEEHWDTVERIYDIYRNYNSEFFLDYYANQCLFFEKDSKNILAISGSNTVYNTLSSSFTVEMMVKPFMTASVTRDFYLFHREGFFSLYITGSTGRLAFSGSRNGIFTSSYGPNINEWSHVVVKASNNTGSFLIDLVNAGNFTLASAITTSSITNPSMAFGNRYVGSYDSNGGTNNVGVGGISCSGSTNTTFYGLMSEIRIWNDSRTSAELSSSYDRPLFSGFSSDDSLITYLRLSEGPLSLVSGSTKVLGSSSLDYSSNSRQFDLGSFNTRTAPVWHPSDNNEYIGYKVMRPYPTGTLGMLKIINIPGSFYGRQISPGTLELVCRGYSNTGISRVLIDDSRGGLYLSGSISTGSVQHGGVPWNKVGNVFYSEGLVVIKDPSLLDFGEDLNVASTQQRNVFSISFRGTERIPTKIMMCRVPPGAANGSNNVTFTHEDDSGKLVKNLETNETYITSVGLYDKHRRLVAIAKLAQPIRKREKDNLNIKLRLDF